MKRLFLCAALSLGVLGCATSSGLNPTTSKSEFDNTKTIDIKPHGLSCKNTGVYCPTLGFRWEDDSPSTAAIRLVILDLYSSQSIGGDYVRIGNLRLKIDGELVTLSPVGSGLTSYNYDKITGRTSTQAYVVPKSLLNKIYSSKETLVQVVTDKGDIEDYIIKPNADTKAYHALNRFLEAIPN
ncbi:hypothetical protein [Pseudoalteromonas nigrifaciens]|uniref:hypothetical protein n=1 Tax=Pseudoalteromonas nigrifaciens TaxID=28109 RepID=UPI0035650BDE